MSIKVLTDSRYVANLFNTYPTGKMFARLEDEIYLEVIYTMLPGETNAYLYAYDIASYESGNVYGDSSLQKFTHEMGKGMEWEFMRPDGTIVEFIERTVYHANHLIAPEKVRW